jgi:hypothetical protein
MHAPFVFSSIQPYLPVAIAVLFYSEFAWGRGPPPLSSGTYHTLFTVGCLLFSKHTEGGGATPAFSSWLVYLQFTWEVLLLTSGGAFLTTATVTILPHSMVAGKGKPLLPSLANLFI